MKCPHCGIAFHPNWQTHSLGQDRIAKFLAEFCTCADCQTGIVKLTARGLFKTHEHTTYIAYPKHAPREPIDASIPPDFTEDYHEACAVLNDSAKASAALSRRCLQHILREQTKVKHSDLSKEIDELLGRNTLPSHLSEALDAIRNIGNFAAHPIKSTNTGEIVPVEPGEAEWCLDVLEQMFDYYFVGPAKTKAKKDALNQKLQDAGKPPMK